LGRVSSSSPSWGCWGKFNLRLGPDLHKKVALEAAERHESMKTYVMKQLDLIDA
jgi:predicted HicB family RNase H-like nuclease